MRFVPPNPRDPRLRVAAVIISLQVLGQTVLGFKVSIAQILISIGVCAAVDIGFTLWRERTLAWPASGLLTGNGTAFILRTAHTQHADWWSLNGIQFFVAASLIGILSKYVVKVGDRHVFNPSNLGLVAILLVVGSPNVFPQYLWWGPLQAPVIAALAVIVVGAVFVLRTVRMVPMAAAFLAAFLPLVAVRAATGGCFAAIWHTGPVCGATYWLDICTSPELLIFVFFMMSDPRTTPSNTRGRMAYAVLTAVLAAGLLSLQPTEYGVKVAILGALTIACTVVPVIDWLGSRPVRAASAWAAARRQALDPVVVGLVLVVVAVPLGLNGLAQDHQLLNLERGALSRPGGGSPQ